MSLYTYCCPTHGDFLTKLSIHDIIPICVPCPQCFTEAPRNYKADLSPVHYNAQGFHRTDYDKNGDKLEQLNRSWSKYYGEEPPKPGSKIPKNSSEKH
jgi:hypothetical protein